MGLLRWAPPSRGGRARFHPPDGWSTNRLQASRLNPAARPADAPSVQPEPPDPICPHCGATLPALPPKIRKCRACRGELLVRTPLGSSKAAVVSRKEAWRLDDERKVQGHESAKIRGRLEFEAIVERTQRAIDRAVVLRDHGEAARLAFELALAYHRKDDVAQVRRLLRIAFESRLLMLKQEGALTVRAICGHEKCAVPAGILDVAVPIEQALSEHSFPSEECLRAMNWCTAHHLAVRSPTRG